MTRTAKRHLDAIKSGAVQKTNVIGIRKALNSQERRRGGYSTGRADPNITDAEISEIERALNIVRPRIVGELHDSGLKLLRSPRYAKRFDEAQRAIIEHSDAGFRLVRFDWIDNGTKATPVYLISAPGGSFLFRNVSWQTVAYGRDDEISGPEIVQEAN